MDAKECRLVRLEIDNSDLGQRLNERLESHVAVCSACAQFRLERAELRELVGSLKPVAAPADFEMRLRARIAREKDRARQPFIFRFALSTPGIALAAVLVLMVAAAVWITQRSRTSKPVEVAKETNTPQPTKDGAPINQKQPDVEAATATAPTTATVATGRNLIPGVKRENPIQRTAKVADSASSDSSIGAARVVSTRSDRSGEVSLEAPSQPMVVTVRDANGQSHKILLPPVSFGAQRFDSRTPVGMTNRKDW